MSDLKKRMREHMNTLCLDIGSKHCGSPELDKAGRYIADCFDKIGLKVVKEEFAVRGWDFSEFSFVNQNTGEEVPASCACYFSNSVNICDKPLWLSSKDVDRLDDIDVKGRLCFVKHWFDAADRKVFGYNAIAEKLDKLGAAAAIFLNRAPHTQLAPSTKIQRSPFLDNLATVAIAEEGAIYMANHPDDTYHLSIKATCFDTTAYNVIGRIGHGSKKAVVGAHYDTAPLVQGAQDDIGGTIIVMEMARLMRSELELLMEEWTIDFVAFSAEEYIPYTLCPGSGDYVMRHKDEDIRFLLNIDDVAPHFSYHEIEIGNAHKLPKIDYPYDVKKATFSGDDKSFNAIGVPSIWIVARKLFGELHTAMDNIAHTDFDAMELITYDNINLLRQLVDAKRWENMDRSTDIRIKKTDSTHLESIGELAVEAWKPIYDGYREQIGEKLFEAFFKDHKERKRRSVIEQAQKSESYVALDGDRVVAFINFNVVGNFGEISSNAVVPAYKGKGIGAKMHNFALEQMKASGCTHASVVTGADEAHTPARKSYEKNGFSVNLKSVKYFKEL